MRSPRATAASTKPRTDCSSVAERTMRAIEGIWTTATPSTSAPLLVPAPVTSTSRKSSGGNASSTSTPRISSGVERACAVAGDEPDRAADQRRRAASRAPASASTLRPPQSTRESTSRAEEVGAERAPCAAAARTGCRSARVGRVRREERPEQRDQRGRTRAGSAADRPRGRACAAKRQLRSPRRRPQLRDEQHDEQVGDDVDDDVDGRDQDRDRLHRAHVADRDRVDELLAEARDRRTGTRRR